MLFSKKSFFELLTLYFGIDGDAPALDYVYDASPLILSFSDNLKELPEYIILVQHINECIKANCPPQDFKPLLAELLNRLLDCFTFVNSPDVPHRIVADNIPEDDELCISVDVSGGKIENADLIVTEDELINAANETYPLDAFSYPRLFYEAKLEKIQEGAVECAICGLSYTQHGIVESAMPIPTVNLSVSGQDIPYSVLLAEKIIKMSERIHTIIIPITYYMGFYDISSDDHPAHEGTVSCVLAPLLNDKRNFTKDIHQDGYMDYPGVFKIYSKISDLKKYREIRDNNIRESLKDKDFFNEMLAQSPTGGLKFDFHTLSGSDKEESAAITEKLNRRVATYQGLEEVVKYLESYANFIKGRDVKTIFFVPPFTKALSEATDKNSLLRKLFYTNIVPLIKEIPGAIFTDLCDSTEFTDADFVDFEHLDYYTGGVKLTKILGRICSNEYSGK